MGLATNKLVLVVVVMKDVSPLDTVRHNMEKNPMTLSLERSRHEGNEDFFI